MVKLKLKKQKKKKAKLKPSVQALQGTESANVQKVKRKNVKRSPLVKEKVVEVRKASNGEEKTVIKEQYKRRRQTRYHSKCKPRSISIPDYLWEHAQEESMNDSASAFIVSLINRHYEKTYPDLV